MKTTKSALLVGVGGQGAILTAKVLVNGLMKAGYDVKMSEVHGMSQRGGSVSTQVHWGEKVYSPVIGKGGADIEFTSSAGYSGRSGDMVGVVPGKPMSDQATGSTIKAIVQLTEIKNVKPSDFFESEGAPHVTVGGRTYRVAGDVECCHEQGSTRFDLYWLTGTGAERLTAIKAYSDDLTIYVDPVGNQVRVIKGN